MSVSKLSKLSSSLCQSKSCFPDGFHSRHWFLWESRTYSIFIIVNYIQKMDLKVSKSITTGKVFRVLVIHLSIKKFKDQAHVKNRKWNMWTIYYHPPRRPRIWKLNDGSGKTELFNSLVKYTRYVLFKVLSSILITKNVVSRYIYISCTYSDFKAFVTKFCQKTLSGK